MSTKVNRHKVAFFLSGGEGGGAAVETKLLCKNLDRNYFDVVGIFCSPGPYFRELGDHIDGRVLLESGRPRQMQIVEGDKWRHSKWAVVKNIGWFARAITKLSRFLKQNNFELVHSNGGYLGLIAGLAAKKAGIKSVWHRRGLLSENVPMGIFLGPLGAIASLCTDQFIGISQSVVDSMPHSWKKKACVVYDGIDFREVDVKAEKTWLREQLGVEEGRLLVGIVGTIVPIKGHKEFIKAANIVYRSFPDVLFVAIGGTPEGLGDYQKQLYKLVDSYGLCACFRWMGNVPGANRYLGGLDVLVSATVPPGEGFGLTLVEAMGQGVPVVATSCGAGPELVPDGKAGFLVPVGDQKRMAEVIIKLLNDATLREELGRYGREWSRRNFEIKITVKNVENIYRNLLRV